MAVQNVDFDSSFVLGAVIAATSILVSLLPSLLLDCRYVTALVVIFFEGAFLVKAWMYLNVLDLVLAAMLFVFVIVWNNVEIK
jgi:hypothetical protein